MKSYFFGSQSIQVPPFPKTDFKRGYWISISLITAALETVFPNDELSCRDLVRERKHDLLKVKRDPVGLLVFQ